ncbi:MAG: ComEC/Rec2 family competence protein, partial [Candidatus Paceibacteria bacterium]
KIINSKSKTFLAFCFCFLFGVAIASITIEHRLQFFYFYTGIVVLIPLLILYWDDKWLRFFILSLLLVFLGFFRFSFGFPPENHVSKFNGDNVELTAVVADEPERGLKRAEYIVEAKQVKNKPISGKVLVRTKLYPKYKYGDKLKVKCKLEQPEPFKGFRYDMYLANFDVFSICRYAKIEYLDSGHGNFLMSSIFSAKRSAAKKVNKLWHEPYSSFMAGMLYGYRSGLGELEERFNKAGITHIIAISGFHVTVVSLILMSLCIYFYIPRDKAFWLVTSGIVLYMVFTGMSASVVRAGIMGSLVLLAEKMGRNSAVLNVLAFTAVVMVFFNPFVLIWNGAFQLSFLATIGLIYLVDKLKEVFAFVPDFLQMREALTATLAAIIMTMPLVLYMFGRVSVVAPLTNVLVIGLVPGLIILGFSAVVISFIYMPLAELLSWVGRFGLEYITKVVKFLTSFSFAAIEFTLPLWAMILLYIPLFYWLYLLQTDRWTKSN